MLNVIIPITGEIAGHRALLDALDGALNVQVYIGVRNDIYDSVLNEYGDKNNFNFFDFDKNTNKEEMINAIQDYLEEGSILILRKPVSIEEFEKIVNSDRDVVTSKRERSKCKAFIFNTWQNLIRMILGVKMYAGDYSVVYMNEDIADVAMSTGNLSYSSRVNRWKGIKQGVITTRAKDEIEYKRTNNLKYMLLAILLLVLGAGVTTVVSIFAQMSIIIALFLFCLDAVCLAIAFILIVMRIFTNLVGKKQCSKAFIMNKKVQNKE